MGRYSLLIAGDATLLTRCRWNLLACMGVGIDKHSLLIAGDATLLTRCRWNLLACMGV